jgi:rare lipoprotein A
MVEVRNVATGRSVTPRINNRGPFRKSRVIDVSKRAAQELGMIKSGVAKVELEVLPEARQIAFNALHRWHFAPANCSSRVTLRDLTLGCGRVLQRQNKIHLRHISGADESGDG